MKYTYKNIYDKFKEKLCTLLTTELEFIENKLIAHSKFKYIASCGHEHIIVFSRFLYKNNNSCCPLCKIKENTIKCIEFYELNTTDHLITLKTELIGINYFKEIIDKQFISKKVVDGCKSDLIIKRRHIIDDKWLGIQFKTCAKIRDSIKMYSFHLTQNYDNIIIICICLENKKIWAIPYKDVQHITGITIGSHKSKYDKYELNEYNINDKLQEFYNTEILNTFTFFNTPISSSQQQEQEFYRYRESKINFLTFTYNDIEGQVFDFKIGDLKIQEKVYSKRNDRKYIRFTLLKNGRINKIKCCVSYEVGDNDFYWLNCGDKKLFYIIPEKYLLLIGKIREKNSIINIKSQFLKTVDIPDKYKFDYDNIDKERMLSLLYQPS